MPRQKTASWASIAIMTLMMASDGQAFSSSPLSSRTLTTPNSATNRIPTTRKRHHQTTTTTTKLEALPSLLAKASTATACFAPPVASYALQSINALSALTATITGGVFAGSLHAIAGPDHLAALIPRCCGLPWYRAVRVGAVWGLGHGVSATLLGMAGFMFKKGIGFSGILGGSGSGGGSFDLLHHAGSFMELAIGFSLIVIGLLGIKEAREWEAPEESGCETNEDGSPVSGTGIGTPQSSPYSSASMAINPNPAKRAVLFNGILHGFSWDGAPSLAPAVAIATWKGSLTFLLSYALGTMAAMALATTIIGEGTRRAAGKLDRPNLPRDLSVASSFLALVVGVVWCGLSLR